MFENIQLRWRTYIYNRSWHKLEAVCNGPLVRLTVSIPLFGYLLLFNDEISSLLTFEEISGSGDHFYFSAKSRLQMQYFGLIFLAVATSWYRYRRPHTIEQGITPSAYVEYGISNFSLYDFIQIFGEADDREKGPVTQYWEYGQNDLDRFIADIEGTSPSLNPLLNAPHNKINGTGASRAGAIDRNSEFVRSMLYEYYAQKTRQRKFEQHVLLFFAVSGYLLLAIPSIDFFLVISRDAFGLHP